VAFGINMNVTSTLFWEHADERNYGGQTKSNVSHFDTDLFETVIDLIPKHPKLPKTRPASRIHTGDGNPHISGRPGKTVALGLGRAGVVGLIRLQGPISVVSRDLHLILIYLPALFPYHFRTGQVVESAQIHLLWRLS
jgi:hypothetical protein